METKELYSLFENNLTIHRLLAKKSYTQSVGLCWYLLHGLTNSRSFNRLQFFSDRCHQLDDNWCCPPSFSSSPKNFRSAVYVGRLVDFLPLGRIKFIVLLIGPTYLRSVQTPNQARTRFFNFCGAFGWSICRHLDMYTSLLTTRPALKNTGTLMPLSLTASHNKIFAWSCEYTWQPLMLGDLQTHNSCCHSLPPTVK
jgi:hypothetical protein